MGTKGELQQRPKALLFDFDGVLVCPKIIVETVLAVARRWNLRLQKYEIMADYSRGRIACLWDYLLELLRVGEIKTSREAVIELEREIYFGGANGQGLCTQERLLLSVGDLERLSTLVERRVAVVTNRPRDRFQSAFEHTGLSASGLFTVTVTCDDVGKDGKKPSSKGVELACANLEVLPADVWMVDDMPCGIEAAHQAGAIAIGFAPQHNFSLRRTLRDAGADMVISSHAELFERIGELN